MGEATTLSQAIKPRGVPTWVINDPRLTLTALRVLGTFYSCADQFGWCYPKNQNSAARLGMSVKAFSKHVTRLRTMGFLERGARNEHGGFWWHVHHSERSRLPEGDSKSPSRGRLLYSTSSGTSKTPAAAPQTVEGEMDTRPDEGLQGCLLDDPTPKKSGGRKQPAPTRTTKERIEQRLSAAGQADRFADAARLKQPGVPDAGNPSACGRAFARWHEQGVSYKEIRAAQDLFWQEFDPTLGPPAWKVFVAQSSVWIDAAKEAIYQEELPKKRAENQRRHDERLERYEQEGYDGLGPDPGLIRYRSSGWPGGQAPPALVRVWKKQAGLLV